MEFERAIYRVYERCMEGMHEEQDSDGNPTTKSCQFLEILCLCCGIFFLIALVVLHSAFVGSAGCLPDILSIDQLNSTTNVTSFNASRQDQIVYISIDSKFRPHDITQDDADTAAEGGRRLRGNILGESYATSYRSFFKFDLYDKSDVSAVGNDTTTTRVTDPPDQYKEPRYDYKFAHNSGLLLLPYQDLVKHNFQRTNVSLMASQQCFGGNFLQSFIPLGGIDTVVVNYMMYTFKDAGHVLTGTGDYYQWSSDDLNHYQNVGEWFNFKIWMLIYSFGAFFFLSTITALLVRVLISSGIVLIFPIFWLLEMFGFHGVNLRIVSISYPWIGVPLEIIRSRNQSIYPFILGHISKVLIYYFLYQCTQLVFAVWFYNRDSPGQQELWIFAIMMLWEYYSMIYTRAALSIQLFPRASLAMFLVYHFYYFSFPAGFHVLALVVMFFFLVFFMIYCLRVYELKAFEEGLIHLDQPRMLYTSLPWPVWRADLAPEYTLMMPLSARSESAYQTTVPARPSTSTSTNTSTGTTGTATAATAVAVGSSSSSSSSSMVVISPPSGSNTAAAATGRGSALATGGSSSSVGGSGGEVNDIEMAVAGSSGTGGRTGGRTGGGMNNAAGIELGNVVQPSADTPAITRRINYSGNSNSNSSGGGASSSSSSSSSSHGLLAPSSEHGDDY